MTNFEDVSDEALLGILVLTARRGEIEVLHPVRLELLRRLRRNPRCPTCERESGAHRGNCRECAAVGGAR